MDNIDFKDNYISWLRENIDQYRISDDIFRITLPFLDHHNDQIEVYITKNNDQYIISDDSFTLNDLQLSGLDIFSSKRRKQIFNQIVNAHGISVSEDGALYAVAEESELPLKKHLLAQCIQRVSDLFCLAQPNVKSLFLEDVQRYLDTNDVRYISEVSFTGKSKLPTNYDFAIPKSKSAPERIIKVVNSLTTEYTRSIIFTWNDISGNRSDNSNLYTFIQDTGKKVPSDAITAFKQYDIHPVLWSKKTDFIPILAA